MISRMPSPNVIVCGYRKKTTGIVRRENKDKKEGPERKLVQLKIQASNLIQKEK